MKRRCLPSCTYYFHSALCPVVHSAEELRVAELEARISLLLGEVKPVAEDAGGADISGAGEAE